MNPIRLGAYSSARSQQRAALACLDLCQALECEAEDLPLLAINTPLTDALMTGTIDAAVIAMDEPPLALPETVAFACVLPRGEVRDATASLGGTALLALPTDARVHVQRPRQRAQLKHLRPDLHVSLEADAADLAHIAAAADWPRLHPALPQQALLDLDDFLPSPGQAATGLLVLRSNAALHKRLHRAHHKPSGLAMQCERAFASGMEAAPQFACAALATVVGTQVFLRSMVLALDGTQRFEHAADAEAKHAVTLGMAAAEHLMRQALGQNRE
jgi:hydroxymethylbilane synthase